MPVVVSLREIVSEMAELGDSQTAYLNRRTGALITVDEETRSLIETGSGPLDEVQGQLRLDHEAGDLLELPGSYEQKLFTIVERFCETVREPSDRDRLVKAIHGKRAMRDFAKVLGRLGLRDRWNGFRNQALEQVAVSWLQEHDLAFDRAA